MNKIFLFVCLVLLSVSVYARPVTIEYQALSLVDCDGLTISLSDYSTIEFYIDVNSIPASDASCATNTVPEDTVPVGVTPLPGSLSPGVNEVNTDLAPGTYFVRFRVRIPLPAGQSCHVDFPDCEWSQFSNQQVAEVPTGTPTAPFIIRITLG